ncbi:MAG: glycosyltransferase family 39 protein, partial [Chloroflexota bacterium]
MALAPRLWKIDLTRFFNDQVWFLGSATALLDNPHIPLSSGLTFAVGTTGDPVRHPPLVIVLLAAAALFNRDPVWVSGCVAAFDAIAVAFVYLIAKRITGRTWTGVAAGALYALSPTAIVFGRMIWNPDFVPVFAALGLLGLVDFWLSARSSSLAFSLFAIGCAVELHVVNAIFLVLWLGVAIAGRRKLRYRPLVVAGLVLIVTIAPYLYLQTQSGWSDMLGLLSYLGKPKTFDLDVLGTAALMAGPAMFGWLLPGANDAVVGYGSPILNGLLLGLELAGLLTIARPPRAARIIVGCW